MIFVWAVLLGVPAMVFVLVPWWRHGRVQWAMPDRRQIPLNALLAGMKPDEERRL